jgi:septal ring factor EnvC (AmiA/AmiB activator)
MREELERTTKQLHELGEDREKMDQMLKQIDDLQQQLDREKKTGKELQTQNVKLRSLVKIGEDSLKAEMRRNDDLANQLKLKNGQVHGTAVSTPCLTTNGNDQESVMSSTSSSSLCPEVSIHADGHSVL